MRKEYILDQPKGLQIEGKTLQVQSQQLTSGKTLISFHTQLNGEKLTSWTVLGKDEYLAKVSFTPELTTSGWFQNRFPQIHPEPYEEYLLSIKETDGAPTIKIIEPIGQSLSQNSPRFQLLETLETTHSREETPLLVTQKAQVKAKITSLVLKELQQGSSTMPSNCVIIGESDLGAVHMLEVTEEIAQNSYIDGDPTSQGNQFNPVRVAANLTRRLQASGYQGEIPIEPIQLLHAGDLLLFTLNDEGKPTFYSSRWGRTSTKLYGEWSVGIPSRNIKEEIDRVTHGVAESHRIKPKILRYLIHTLVGKSEWTYPARKEESRVTTLQQAINERLQDQLARVSPYDTSRHTLSRYLMEEWLPEEKNRLREQFATLATQHPNFATNKLNLMPESYVQDMYNRGIHLEQAQLLEEFVNFDSSISLGKYITQLTMAAGLISLGILRDSDPQVSHTRYLTIFQKLTDRDREVAQAINRLGKAAMDLFEDDEKAMYSQEVARQRIGQVIRESLAPLTTSDHIDSIRLQNISSLRAMQAGDTFVLSAQFCPLYTDDPRPLNEFARLDDLRNGTEDDIIRSAVGPKWIATQQVIHKLREGLAKLGIKLKVQAAFGDVGAIVSSREWADPALLEKQAALYQKELEEFCKHEGVEVEFHRFSEYSQQNLPRVAQVPQYIIVNEGTILTEEPSLETLLRMWGLENNVPLQSRAQQDSAMTFMKRLQMSGLNNELARQLTHTYVSLLPLVTKGADAQLGMELADIYLALTSAIPDSRQAKMPAINVLAK